MIFDLQLKINPEHFKARKTAIKRFFEESEDFL
jgi:hypothetical protein